MHEVLVSELNTKPDGDFQLIPEFEQGAMVFAREFRGGPRSQDWTVIRITDGLERGRQAKRRCSAWLFEVANGRIVHTRLYAATARVRS